MNEKVTIASPHKTETEVTPEEKLFRLIAAAGKDDSELQELLTRFAQPPKRNFLYQFLNTGSPNLALPFLRSVLLVFLGCLTFYFLSGISVGRTFYMAPGARFGEVGIAHASDFFPKFFAQENIPSASNLNKAVEIKTPEIVIEPVKPAAAAAVVVPEVSSVLIPTPAVKPAPYRLVGISRDDQGKVAMIEAGQSRAKFVREGDLIEGETKVETINEYTVTLAAGEKRWELT